MDVTSDRYLGHQLISVHKEQLSVTADRPMSLFGIAGDPQRDGCGVDDGNARRGATAIHLFVA